MHYKPALSYEYTMVLKWDPLLSSDDSELIMLELNNEFIAVAKKIPSGTFSGSSHDSSSWCTNFFLRSALIGPLVAGLSRLGVVTRDGAGLTQLFCNGDSSLGDVYFPLSHPPEAIHHMSLLILLF